MKKITTLFMFLTLVLSVSACGKSSDVLLKAGIYTLQNAGQDVPGDFTITIYENGTFQYYESPVSSYIGIGRYYAENDRVVLEEEERGDTGRINYYQMADGSLQFILDGSANYRYVSLEDGALFVWTSDVP